MTVTGREWPWRVGLAALGLAVAGPVLAQNDCARGEALYNQAQQADTPEQRLGLLEQAIAACPSFTAWYTAGRTRLELGQPPEALAAFQEARRLAGDNRSAGLALGRTGEAYLAQGRSAEASAAVEAALELLPDPKPDWLLALRRTLDTQLAAQELPAQLLRDTLAASRSFGATPRVRVRIQFASDSAALDQAGQRQVTELGRALTSFKAEGYRIRIIGHTDALGRADYNQRLSERRARAVAAALARDFPTLAGALGAEGRGETEPLYPGDSSEDHALNRRVEVQLQPRP